MGLSLLVVAALTAAVLVFFVHFICTRIAGWKMSFLGKFTNYCLNGRVNGLATSCETKMTSGYDVRESGWSVRVIRDNSSVVIIYDPCENRITMFGPVLTYDNVSVYNLNNRTEFDDYLRKILALKKD